MRSTLRFLAIAILSVVAAQTPLMAQHSTSELKAKIQKNLDWDYPDQISVAVQEPGIVTLKGNVKSYWDWRNVFAIAARIPGVHEIRNEVVVQTDKVPDNVIKEEIVNYLGLVRAIEDPKRIEVVVTNGLVILRGRVDSAREANAVEDIASWHQGVKSVVNEIRVLPPREAGSDANLAAILRDLIARDFPLERSTVQVQVKSGRATLSGTVGWLWASHNIEKEVQRIQGITAVDNQLKIHTAS